MNLVNLQEISLAFGGSLLLDRVSLQIETGERVCLVGRNGEGKSSLLKIINGDLPPDSGRVIRCQNLKTAMLSQEVPADQVVRDHTRSNYGRINGKSSVYDMAASGLGELQELLVRYREISETLNLNSVDYTSPDYAKKNGELPVPALLAKLSSIQAEIEAVGAWNIQQQVETVLSRLQLDPDAVFFKLSGGMKRKTMLARALVSSPDLLLLDEPSNHLDIDSIKWLEQFLKGLKCSLIFITHDRMLAANLASRIMDLDRGVLTSWPGDWQAYLKKKEKWLAVGAEHQKKFDKQLSREEIWIRQGIKARRSRNQGRVRALQAMRQERRSRRELSGKAKMELQEAERSGKLVVRARNVSYSYGTEPVITDFSTTILRGDKVGLIGPNGCGKTTLLNLLLGYLKPGDGQIKFGTNLQVAYFDQMRAQLTEEATVAENVGDGGNTVTVNNQNRHIIGYLRDFLFTPDRARSPVAMLSGGERNRLLLARLFTRPANLLVMDEPTNDLDMETLELLEELLVDYQGTVLLVSHDRAFLDNVVSSTLAYEGKSFFQEYAGGYSDWLKQKKEPKSVTPRSRPPDGKKVKPVKNGTRKLSFKEKRELNELPEKIEILESEQKGLYITLADPEFYRKDGTEISGLQSRLVELEKELEEAYRRWETLEEVSSSIS
ncbi:MAG: ATP-binding cassette domain-containing protein [Thermodesulfobacteriota bacterium]